MVLNIAGKDLYWDDICESKILMLKMLKAEKVRQVVPQKKQQAGEDRSLKPQLGSK